MSSTYLSLHYHIVFSTKERRPMIADAWKSRLHEYLGGTVKGLDGFPQRVGGVADHVHLLVGLKSTHCLADFLRELKKASSAWVHNEIVSGIVCMATRLLGVHSQRDVSRRSQSLHRQPSRAPSATVFPRRTARPIETGRDRIR